MKSLLSLIILGTLWSSTWVIGLNTHLLFGSYRYYHFLLLVAAAAILMRELKKRYGMQYFYLGLFGLFMEIVFSFLTSPHRMYRLNMWFDLIGLQG